VREIPSSRYQPLLSHLADRAASRSRSTVEQDPQRDELLQQCRRMIHDQIVHDLSFNIQQLWRWALELEPSHQVLSDAQIQDAFRQLDLLRQQLEDSDEWSGNVVELKCWISFQQFYTHALSLGWRLLNFEKGIWRKPGHKTKQYQIAEGCSAFSRRQSLMNALQQTFPNILEMRPLSSVFPGICYTAIRSVVSGPRYRWLTMARKFRKVVSSGALASLSSRVSPAVEVRGLDALYSDNTLFDPSQGKTRHNLVLAISHRHSVIDLPIFSHILHGKEYAVWANELFFPKSAMRDPKMVLVKPGAKRTLQKELNKSADITIHGRMPLLIFVDGGGPYLPYGQQMRVKRGIRLLADFLDQKSKGTNRRTYIVPFSLNDTITFVKGLDPKIQATFHQPICTADIAAAPERPDPQQCNYGDPLLNHLECFFLSNTGQVRHGIRTPRVEETVRRFDRRLAGDPSLRKHIKKLFHAAMYDLSNDQASLDLPPI